MKDIDKRNKVDIIKTTLMIAKRKKTFAISQNPIVAVSLPNNDLQAQDIEIKYYTDSVYHSLVYRNNLSFMQLSLSPFKPLHSPPKPHKQKALLKSK